MNYTYALTGSSKPTPVPAASKKKSKRKSPVPTLREWQKLNFEHMALVSLKNQNRHPDVIEKLQKRIDALDEKRKQGRRTMGVYITYGAQSVSFFIQNPQYIPTMKNEIWNRQAIRRAALERGEKGILDQDLDNPVLSAHCQRYANLIFTKGNSSDGDNTWDYSYFHIRNNYIETMGRAARAAEYALGLERIFEEERRQAFIDIQKPKEPQTTEAKLVSRSAFREAPIPQVIDHWSEPRPSEEQVNEDLYNHCDDNVPGMEDKPEPFPETPKANKNATVDPKPVRVASQPVYVQSDFLHILENQKN